jgi:predicted ABC-type ATPase
MIQKPVLIIIAGPNGSGKTSLTEELLGHHWIKGCTYVNPDTIANEVFGDWNSSESVFKAAQYAEQIREKCLEDNKSLIFETVFSIQDKIDFIKKAKDKGYFVRLFFVGTNHPSINASRIAHRVMEGGHDVPITKIINRYSKSISNCAIISTFVDRLYVYDNSVDYQEPILLFRVNDGIVAKKYREINNWARGILNTVETEIKKFSANNEEKTFPDNQNCNASSEENEK